MDRARALLVEHVRGIQRDIRTCTGCGMCCTAAYNSVRILPVEGARIARYVQSRGAERAKALKRRMLAAIARFGLARRPGRQPYTCPFLEADFSCTLPFDVKPVACLSFNPVTPDQCEMDAVRFNAAHAGVENANAAAKLSRRRLPIPIAVLGAWEPPPRRRKA